jgi:hypothetical protein
MFKNFVYQLIPSPIYELEFEKTVVTFGTFVLLYTITETFILLYTELGAVLHENVAGLASAAATIHANVFAFILRCYVVCKPCLWSCASSSNLSQFRRSRFL